MTYICNALDVCDCPDRPVSHGGGPGHCWHQSTARRIAQQGGPSANAAADLAAWNRLGNRTERAA